jgi:hypothetical protein
MRSHKYRVIMNPDKPSQDKGIEMGMFITVTRQNLL